MMNILEPRVSDLDQARASLLSPFNLDEALLLKTFGEICSRDVDFADIYFQKTRREGWNLEEGIVKAGRFSIDQGVGVRAIVGDRTAFAYSGELSPEALAKAAKATRVIGDSGTSGAARVGSADGFRATTTRALYLSSDPIAALAASDKVALLERVDALARKRDPRITRVSASLDASHDIVLIARSDGTIAADVRPLVLLSISVIAEQNGRRELGKSGGGGRHTYDFYRTEVIESYVESAVSSALAKLEAQPAPAGQMTVVLGPGWPGILLHEAVGHGLEGDFNRKGTSIFSGRIGDRVAAKGVTIVDDGTLLNRRGSLNVDDEGNPTQCTPLIEDGILRGYMQDTLNARLMNMPVTGNARRESYATLPMPRMTNTYMLAGDKDPAEILASVKKGIYAVNFGGGQVDITNGKFTFSASDAYMIEDGKLTYPVKGATLVGNGPESLKYVSMIGNNMVLDNGIGVCGKEGQSLPVGVGQPSLRIDGMTVGGTRQRDRQDFSQT